MMLGLIGLGLVGSSLVDRFKAAGFEVIGYDIDSSKIDDGVTRGMVRGDSVRHVAESARRVVLSLPDSDVVDDVISGEGNLLSALQPNDLIIDTTTTDPERAVKVASQINAKGAHFLDATILGSSKMVADGTALAMVGGDEGHHKAARDILDTFARKSFHMGPNGKGAEAKLVLNLVLGLNRLVMAEGLMLGRRAGIDLSTLLDVLKEGAAYSRQMDTKGNKMVDEEFSTEARLSQHLKDVGLILDMGMRLDTKLPISAPHADVLREGVSSGYGDADNSAVIKALEHFIQRD